MSIGIAIAVPDGIALAADTQTTWNQTRTKAKVKINGEVKEVDLAEPIQMPIGWGKMARKLFSIKMKEKVYAVVTAGCAQINSRSMFSVFQSGAHRYTGDGSFMDVSDYFVGHIKQEFVKQFSCKVEDLSKQPFNVCDFILAGFEDDDVVKPSLINHLVFTGQPVIDGKPNCSGHLKRWSNLNEQLRYGGCWVGRTEFVSHIVKHEKPELPPIQGQYNLMTLSDAVDYTKFLVEFTCDYQRFALMVPDCGRPIISATLTPDGYQETVIS